MKEFIHNSCVNVKIQNPLISLPKKQTTTKKKTPLVLILTLGYFLFSPEWRRNLTVFQFLQFSYCAKMRVVEENWMQNVRTLLLRMKPWQTDGRGQTKPVAIRSLSKWGESYAVVTWQIFFFFFWGGRVLSIILYYVMLAAISNIILAFVHKKGL